MSLPVVPLVSMHEGSSGLPVLTSVSIVFPLLEFSLPTFQNDWAVHGQAEVVVLSSLAVGCFRCGIWGSPPPLYLGSAYLVTWQMTTFESSFHQFFLKVW